MDMECTVRMERIWKNMLGKDGECRDEKNTWRIWKMDVKCEVRMER